MTGTPGQFNQKSDNAAQALKAELNAKNRGNPDWSPLEPAPVAVGPDGQPPAPPPPEGSYARAAYDQHMAAQMQRQVVGDQPPAGTPDQQADGSVAPPLTSGAQLPAAPEGQPAPQVSENANNRIRELIAANRDLERRLAESSGTASELEALQQQVRQLQGEREAWMQQHLDELDPETKAQVLAEAKMREIVAANNRELLDHLAPQLSTLQMQNQQTEYDRLAAKYPGFDLQIHQPLIDTVRAKNPGLSIEMAFKAVAEGDEAVTREQAAHVAVPPIVPAGNGAHLPKSVPEPQADPTDELRAFQLRAQELLRSEDPAERREGMRGMDAAIAERLRGSSYEGKPGVF